MDRFSSHLIKFINICLHDFSWDFINQTLLLRPVPYFQKGSHFVDLWMFPVLFSGIALRLTLQLLNKSITIQFQLFQHLFLFLCGTVLKRIWYLGTGRN